MEYRKKPVRVKSHETIGVILDATLELLRKQEIEAISTNGIAKRAGVGIGTLYLYFENKEQIILALIDREYEKQFSRLQGVIGGAKVQANEDYLRRFFSAVLDTEQLHNMIVFLSYLPILERYVGKSEISRKIKGIIFVALERIEGLHVSSPRGEVMVDIIYELVRSVLGSIPVVAEVEAEAENQARTHQYELLVSELTRVLTSYISCSQQFAKSG